MIASASIVSLASARTGARDVDPALAEPKDFPYPAVGV